jgi:crotonobetainyl-CoA:carnitine CoA-transferase CaiB-like acyl-CoA transferase
MADLAAHPELTERSRWREVDSPAGMLRALVPPGIPAGITPRMDPVPALGQHTDSILEDLGYSAAQIAELRSNLVV